MYKIENIKTEIFDVIKSLLDNKNLAITDDTPLIGSDSLLDSMKLVELCIALEEKASVIGFDFDWTSDVAMSKTRSMFRTAGSIAAEFVRQMELQK